MRTDNEIWQIIFSVISGGLNAIGMPAAVVQSHQPTQQGTENTAEVTIHSIDSKRYGFPEDTSYYDELTDTVIRRKGYWLERTYQVNALSIQNPSTPTAPTAFDYVDAVASILQTIDTQQILHDNGIGILRIQPLRVAYFVNDKGRNEQVPSFDFTLSYKQITLSEVDPIVEITVEIHEV